ncbi:uncharacterized protein HaLaN_12644, partial [Haematococcus lacustris]
MPSLDQPPPHWVVLRAVRPPPSVAQVLATWEQHGLLPTIHQEPFFGDVADKPARPTVFAGREWRIPAASDTPVFVGGQ